MKNRLLLSICISIFLSFSTCAMTDEELTQLRTSADKQLENLYKAYNILSDERKEIDQEDENEPRDAQLLAKLTALLNTERAKEKLKDMTKLTVEEQVAFTLDERVRIAREAPAENRYKELKTLLETYDNLSSGGVVDVPSLILASLVKLLTQEQKFLERDNQQLTMIEKLIYFIDPSRITKTMELTNFHIHSQQLLVIFTNLGLNKNSEETDTLISSFKTHWRIAKSHASDKDYPLAIPAKNAITLANTKISELLVAFEEAETREHKAEAIAAMLEIHNAILPHLK